MNQPLFHNFHEGFLVALSSEGKVLAYRETPVKVIWQDFRMRVTPGQYTLKVVSEGTFRQLGLATLQGCIVAKFAKELPAWIFPDTKFTANIAGEPNPDPLPSEVEIQVPEGTES